MQKSVQLTLLENQAIIMKVLALMLSPAPPSDATANEAHETWLALNYQRGVTKGMIDSLSTPDHG